MDTPDSFYNSSLNHRISWFPGHMRRTMKLIEKNLKGTDLMIEVVDARIPLSSRSQLIYRLTKNFPRVLFLTKIDLADHEVTNAWQRYFISSSAEKIRGVLTVNTKENRPQKRLKDIKALTQLIQKEKSSRSSSDYKVLITGVPNVGKSSTINYLSGRNKTRVENRPGVTRGEQIIQVGEFLRLIDLPGLLDPKLDHEVGYKMALLGLIKDEIIDFTEVGLWFCDWLINAFEQNFFQDHFFDRIPFLKNIKENLDAQKNMEAVGLLEYYARSRGWSCFQKGEIDFEKAGYLLSKEVRSGKWGCLSLEIPQK